MRLDAVWSGYTISDWLHEIELQDTLDFDWRDVRGAAIIRSLSRETNQTPSSPSRMRSPVWNQPSDRVSI